MTDATDGAMLDPDRFGELRELYRPGELRAVVEVFLDSTPETISWLRAAYETGDHDGVRHAAHRLRGGALALGATRLAELAGLVEAASVEASDGPRGADITAIEDMWTSLAAVLVGELS